MDQDQFEEFFDKLEVIEKLCSLYEVLKPMRAFNEENSKLNDYGVGSLISQLKKRGEGILAENLERVNQLGGDAYYRPISNRISNLEMKLEHEVANLNVDLQEEYKIGEESLIHIWPDEATHFFVYLFCPEGEYREEAISVFGDEEFERIFDESDNFSYISDAGPHHSEKIIFGDHIKLRTPIADIKEKGAWINTIEEIIENSELYQKALEVSDNGNKGLTDKLLELVELYKSYTENEPTHFVSYDVMVGTSIQILRYDVEKQQQIGERSTGENFSPLDWGYGSVDDFKDEVVEILEENGLEYLGHFEK